MADNILKSLLGNLGYALVKPLLRNVRIEFDANAQLVNIMRLNEVTKCVKFAEIEKVVNEQN